MIETLLGSAVLIVIIVAIRKLFYEKLSKRFLYSLWLVFILRLTVLTLIEIPYGFFVGEYPLHSLSKTMNQMIEDNEMIPYTTGDNSILIDDEILNIKKEISFAAVLLCVWCIGILVVLLVHLIPLIKMWKNLKQKRILLINKDEEQLRVYMHQDIPAPFLFGRDIYCPESITMDEGKMKAVIRHETVHFHHLDPVWNMFRCLITAIYWFNPFVWVASCLSKQDAEYACDEAVVESMCEEEKEQYCKVLLEIASGYSFVKKSLYMETGMASGKIANRVKQIVAQHSYKKAGAFVIALLLLLFTMSTLSVEAANYYHAEELVLSNLEYKTSEVVSIKEIIYDRGKWECIFENASEGYYVIESILLISYDSVKNAWNEIIARELPSDKTAFIIPSENADKKFVIPTEIKQRNYSQVVVGKKKTEYLEDIYGKLLKGTYFICYVVRSENGINEFIYRWFDI